MTTIQDIADKLNISKGTVSKALNNAPDISEALQKQILETAVELGYTRLRRYKNAKRKLCIIVQKDNIQYKESHQIDNDEGMDLAVSHLKALGHQKIAYLSSALGSHIMQVRHRAFFQAMHHYGLKADSNYAGCSYYLSECMEKHLPRFLDMGMTAVICCQDTFASAALTQCQQLGYRIPQDISIIGFDDLPICPYTSPPLTTVRQDRIELGKSGYYALNSLMNQVSIGTILLHAQLIERNSSGPAPEQNSHTATSDG
ncbi:MAG TPA: LacI family transcriptional regulator [Candidatus Mediterraneibacter norwichensis]|nr:LacI family transcriptional regulator [Candidatus Mediterraneibacter norwichensis]